MARKLFYGFIIGLCAGLAALALWQWGVLDRFEGRTWDWRVQSLARPGFFTDRIRLIMIDQASLDWVKKEMAYGWPWPRSLYQPILDFCRRQGAKAVAFDLMFTENSSYGVEDDHAFAAAITGAPPFVAALFLGYETGSETNWPPELADSMVAAEGIDEWIGCLRRKKGIIFPRASFPISEIASSSALLGNVSARPDADAIFRRLKPFAIFDGRPVPSLPLAAWLAASTNRTVLFEPQAVSIGGHKIFLDQTGAAIINFRGPSGTHKRLSAAAVIQTELRLQSGESVSADDMPSLKDCYVLLGCNAPGLLDLRPAPVGRVYTGVELHATVLDNLLARDFMRDFPRGLTACLILSLGVFWGMAAVFSRSARDSLIALMLALPLPVVLAVLAYRHGWWLPLMAPEAATVFALMAAVMFNYATEGKQKRFIRGAFKQYLSEEVIEQLVQNPERLALGGEQKTLSIFFSDLQGFTSISENLSPKQLTSLLNEYLTAMTDIIQAEGGTLDKYEGDAIIAFWNAPLDQADHAARAVRAAMRCQSRLAEMRPDLRARTGKDLFMRIGLNTGPVVVGNMGSHIRFNYTILGDAANLASRLEGINKIFGTYTLASEATRQGMGADFAAREVGLVAVVGRKTPVRVFEPMPLEKWKTDRELFELFAEALEKYYGGRFAEAVSLFEKISGRDGVAAAYAAKCRVLMEDKPENWQGVWVAGEK